MIRNKENFSAEVTLWAHVIMQALEDLAHVPTASCPGGSGIGIKAYKTHCDKCEGKDHAKWWILHSSGDMTSFPSVCEIVGMDPDIIRKKLKERKFI